MQDNDTWRQVPVFVFTSMDITQDIREKLAGKAAAIFQKGNYSREELTQHIHRAVQTHLNVPKQA